MMYIKKWCGGFCGFFKENIILSIIYILLIPAFIFGYMRTYSFFAKGARTILCLADYFIAAKGAWFFYLVFIIPTNFLCVSLHRHDFKLNHIIRQRNLTLIWKKQSLYALLTALFITVYHQIITAVIGLANYTVSINFHEKRSMFSIANQGVVSNSVSLLEVILHSSIFCFLAILFFNMLYLFMKWLVNYDIICFIVIFLIGMVDSAGIGVFKISGVDFRNWLPYRPVMLLVPAAGIALLYIAGLNFAKRKEFINAK